MGPNISHNTENLFCVINQDFFFFFFIKLLYFSTDLYLHVVILSVFHKIKISFEKKKKDILNAKANFSVISYYLTISIIPKPMRKGVRRSCLLLELLPSLHESEDDQPSSGLHQLLHTPHKNVQHGHLLAQTGNPPHHHLQHIVTTILQSSTVSIWVER